MNALRIIVAILLILIGIGIFGYRSVNYKTDETLVQVGNVEVTAEKEKSVPLPPILGGVCIAVGVILLFIDRKKK